MVVNIYYFLTVKGKKLISFGRKAEFPFSCVPHAI